MGNMHANVWQLSIQKKSHLSMISNCHCDRIAFLALFLLLLLLIEPATAQQITAEAQPLNPNINNKSDFTIMGIVVIMFFISGFLSLYSRQCGIGRARTVGTINLAFPTGDTGHPLQSESYGLSQEIIDTFPTFLYSNVKGLKIGKGTLACAVCLNEFQDDETLRLIPKCNHVFHPSCIDVWLASHSTCPVCRANLVPTPEDTHAPPMVSIQIPDHDQDQRPKEEETVTNDVESPKVDYLLHRSHTVNHSRPTRSRSTGFLFSVLFPRCNSTGHSSAVVVQPGENLGRFTLRLPDEVRSQVLKSGLKRANSSVSFTRMSSGRKGYRTRSVGSGRGRFGSEEEWRFTLTPPFFTRNTTTWSWNRSGRKSHVQYCSGVALLDNNYVGDRSSDPLCPG